MFKIFANDFQDKNIYSHHKTFMIKDNIEIFQKDFDFEERKKYHENIIEGF